MQQKKKKDWFKLKEKNLPYYVQIHTYHPQLFLHKQPGFSFCYHEEQLDQELEKLLEPC